jgi:hypothetical protein
MQHFETMNHFALLREELLIASDVPPSNKKRAKLQDDSEIDIKTADRRKSEELGNLQMTNQVLEQQFENEIKNAEEMFVDLVNNFEQLRGSLEEEVCQIGRALGQNVVDLCELFSRQIRETGELYALN